MENNSTGNHNINDLLQKVMVNIKFHKLLICHIFLEQQTLLFGLLFWRVPLAIIPTSGQLLTNSGLLVGFILHVLLFTNWPDESVVAKSGRESKKRNSGVAIQRKQRFWQGFWATNIKNKNWIYCFNYFLFSFSITIWWNALNLKKIIWLFLNVS